MSKRRKVLPKQPATRPTALSSDAACDLEQLELPGVLAVESPQTQDDHDSQPVTQASTPVAAIVETAAPAMHDAAIAGSLDCPQDPSIALLPVMATAITTAIQDQAPQMVTVGVQLKRAREQHAISREEMARRLRVPPAIIENIESERWEKLGAPVYVRGHLINYARALQLPLDRVEGAFHEVAEPAPLTLAVAAEPAAPWFTKHARTMSYVGLTLLLAVPVLNLIPKRGINSPVPLVRLVDGVESINNIDSSVVQDIAVTSSLAEDVGLPLTGEASLESNVNSFPNSSSLHAPPLMASMAPMAEVLQRSALVPRQHRLRFELSADSWVEVIDAQGMRLEYGMLRTGEVREHIVEGATTMNFGNASGVALSVDEKTFDLIPHTRLNVARVKLFDSSPTTSPATR